MSRLPRLSLAHLAVISASSVQSDQKPASARPVHQPRPQPVQVQRPWVHQVFPEGQTAALPHEILPW